MKIKILLLFITLAITSSCSEKKDVSIKLECESPYTDERRDNIEKKWNFYIEGYNRGDFRDEEDVLGIGGFVVKATVDVSIDSTNECIEKNLPAEKYIFYLKERYINEIGNHLVTSKGGECETNLAGGFDSYEESLINMTVTENSLKFEGGLSIDKSTLRGKKLWKPGGPIWEDTSFGLYNFYCRIEKSQ